ncbi:MAG: hypothetical protein KBH07_10100 [Flavobacteriales bacterium]|nr:hypothetical protein [Flavobacteriales bacterium]MBP9081393.1 hypothetical protein [Flavobacteriales bacterium]
MKRTLGAVAAMLFAAVPSVRLQAQGEEDTITNVYQLGDVVIHGRAEGLDLEGFMQQVKNDTSFLHAFLNMRYWPHAVESGLTVRNKGEKEKATLYRKGRFFRKGQQAELRMDSTAESGNLRSRKGEMRYLTAELYDDLFWPKGTWAADNSIAAYERARGGHGRMEKYKEELKQFMFNPGQEIASVPFIGDKLALFEPAMAPLYDFGIDQQFRNGQPCWMFSAEAKDSLHGKPMGDDATVIKRMRTWFDQRSMQVLAREYRIAHASLILDFDISIQVDNTVVGGELVPTFIRYDGDWDIPLHKREIVGFWMRLTDWSTH